MKQLILIALVILLSSSTVLAQDFCQGDFTFDADVDADDVTIFLEHFGRGQYYNPCPPDGPAPVPMTGQTTSFEPSDDGDYEYGAAWPNPRFADNENGTVTDNLTGLIWLKDANCMITNYPEFDNDGTPGDGPVTWQHALDFITGINSGTYELCNAGYSDWRLPNSNELASLVHKGYYNPALPDTAGTGQSSEGDPFNNVQSLGYWSSTTFAHNSDSAWYVYMAYGYVYSHSKTVFLYYLWPVRGGH